MRCRGIRGATIVPSNTREGIVEATKELLTQMRERNGVKEEDVSCIIFTTTPDLDAEFPATAAREMGWAQVALLGAQEMAVPGSLSHCLRILMLWNTEKSADEISHVYLKGAKELRPDLTAGAERC